MADRWQGFWAGDIGVWVLERGVRIGLLLIGGLLAARFINWGAQRIVRRIDVQYQESAELVRSESTKHRQAVASVISWVSVALLFVVVAVEITDILAIPVGSLVAPAAVLGAALGFGAQRIVQDLLAGFFIITEKQYGFGDLVALTVAGIAAPAEGTVEDVTLRVTKLRSSEGEMFTIPNGQIVKSVNLSKDWARAVIDIPVPTSADLNVVNDLLHEMAEKAMDDPQLHDLLLDAPQLMGVESIELETVNLRMVARTLPGKQFEVGRRLRVLVIRALRRAGITAPSDGQTPMVAAIPHPSEVHEDPEDTEHAATRASRSRNSDFVVQGQARPDADVDGCADRRVHRAVLGPADVRAQARGAGAGGRAARLRAGSQLHVGAEDQRAAAQGAGIRDHNHHDQSDRDQPDRDEPDRDDATHRDHQPDLADGHHGHDAADQRHRPRWCWPVAAADRTRGAVADTGHVARSRVGTGGDGARVAAVARPSPLHWRAVMITLDHVSKQYKSSARPALDNVSVKIDKGEFVFLIGPSGSGKSTFMRLLLAEDSPSQGDIRVSKFHVNKLSGRHIPGLRQVIGCVFQDFRLLQQKTVFDNVAFALEVIGKRGDVINRVVPDVLEMVGLSGKANRLPGELSGGEQQRVAIARAFVNRPLVLLADEPTGNLDPETSKDIMDLLERINRTGTTVLMATHDHHIVDSMRQRVVELELGRLIRDEQRGVYGMDR